MPIDPPKGPNGDDPKPGSTQDLDRRLNGLPDGHPSSRYKEDGSPKSPEPRWQNIEIPEADKPERPLVDGPQQLTDAEHAEHVKEVRTRLDKARSDGLATDQQYTTDPDQAQWTPARDRIQGDLVAEMYGRTRDVPCDYRAVIAGGLGGAGKSTVLDRYADIDRSQYLVINPDDIKEQMARRDLIPEVEGLSPMEASDLVHEESSQIAKQLARRAQGDGKNVIWDITMRSRASTDQRIDDLRSAGYTRVEGIFVDIPVEKSIARADARHREGHDDYLAGKGLGGRFVPEDVIRRQADSEWGSVNRKTFEAVKNKFDSCSIYDNSVDGGVPVLVEASQREEEAL